MSSKIKETCVDAVNESLPPKVFTKKDLKKAYSNGFRLGSVAGMRVAHGGELNVKTFDQWFNEHYQVGSSTTHLGSVQKEEQHQLNTGNYIPEKGDLFEWCDERYWCIESGAFSGVVCPVGGTYCLRGFIWNFGELKQTFIRKGTAEDVACYESFFNYEF